jgi:hypothetical protein
MYLTLKSSGTAKGYVYRCITPVIHSTTGGEVVCCRYKGQVHRFIQGEPGGRKWVRPSFLPRSVEKVNPEVPGTIANRAPGSATAGVDVGDGSTLSAG